MRLWFVQGQQRSRKLFSSPSWLLGYRISLWVAEAPLFFHLTELRAKWSNALLQEELWTQRQAGYHLKHSSVAGFLSCHQHIWGPYSLGQLISWPTLCRPLREYIRGNMSSRALLMSLFLLALEDKARSLSLRKGLWNSLTCKASLEPKTFA